MGAQFDNDEFRQRRRTERNKKMKSEKRRQVFFRRILKAGFVLMTVLVLSAVGREVVIRYIAQEQETARKAGQEALTGGAGAGGESVEAADGSGAAGGNGENGTGGSQDGGSEGADADSSTAADDGTGAGGDAGTADGDENATGADGKSGSAGGEGDEAGDGSGDSADGSKKIPGWNAHYQKTGSTKKLKDKITSGHAVIIDMDTGEVLAQKGAGKRIVPASMTKVLTVLVAVEQLESLEQLDDKFKITAEITDYCYLNGCSVAGFAINEKVTVRDMLYGTILPSGADAALGLAEYIAGSHEAFVDLMNKKLEELGLSETAHFTNCVGIYNEDHYCTVLDMAYIMQTALQNETVREVLSARIYTTSKTKQHPDGLEISNWFVRRIEDKDTGGAVSAAKTGYVEQSGNCAVSYGVDKNGRKALCVTTNAPGTWKCIYDHVYLYKKFSKR